MFTKSKGKLVMVFLILSMLLSGCYWNEVLSPNQMAVQLREGEIFNVSGPGGKYSDSNFWADLLIIDIDTLTFSVEDPEVLTSDNQAVSMKITIQARRQADSDSIKNLVKNWNGLKDNVCEACGSIIYEHNNCPKCGAPYRFSRRGFS